MMAMAEVQRDMSLKLVLPLVVRSPLDVIGLRRDLDRAEKPGYDTEYSEDPHRFKLGRRHTRVGR